MPPAWERPAGLRRAAERPLSCLERGASKGVWGDTAGRRGYVGMLGGASIRLEWPLFARLAQPAAAPPHQRARQRCAISRAASVHPLRPPVALNPAFFLMCSLDSSVLMMAWKRQLGGVAQLGWWCGRFSAGGIVINDGHSPPLECLFAPLCAAPVRRWRHHSPDGQARGPPPTLLSLLRPRTLQYVNANRLLETPAIQMPRRWSATWK